MTTQETMNAFKVPESELIHRCHTIQAKMAENQMDALFIVQRTDLFYFSGTAQTGFLYIPVQGDPILFIRRYLPRAMAESSLSQIMEIASVKQIPDRIRDFTGTLPATVGFELDVMPVNEFQFYKKLFPDSTCKDASQLILDTRKIKSPWELDQIRETAQRSCRTFQKIPEIIRPGITEMGLAAEVEAFARQVGHAGHVRARHYLSEAYAWHILSGASGGMVGLLDAPASGEGTSAAFPCGAGYRSIGTNEPVMIDFGFIYNGYHTDETRMFSLGPLPDRVQQACLATIDIHDSVLDKVRPGIPVRELFDHAVDMARSMGYEDQFLGPNGYKVAFIGHGIGLELVEPPFIARGKTDLLEPGMVFALEPKMVFENEFCAGVESVFQVTETGSQLISQVPVEIFIC